MLFTASSNGGGILISHALPITISITPLEPIRESSRIAPMPLVRSRRAAFDVGRNPAIIVMARSLD
jgi:hypothetical protein